MKKKSESFFDKKKKEIRKILFKAAYPSLYRKLDDNIFLVYTMGKVGSITVQAGIEMKFPFNEVFHIHFLSPHGLQKHKEFNKTESGYKLAEKFDKERNKFAHKRLKVITLVREPIARDISDLFENYYRYIPGQLEAGIDFDKMIEHFKNFDHDYALNWFDDELKAYFDVDIYSVPFDKVSGYTIINAPNFDLLIMRLEDLSFAFDKAMTQFTGVNGWEIGPGENTAGDKFYSQMYKRFKEQVVIAPSVLSKVYNSKYFNHFYSPKDKERFFSKWSLK